MISQLLMTKFVTLMQIHSSAHVLLVLLSISRLPTLIQKESARTPSTLVDHQIQSVDTMQCSTVIFLMQTLHSSDALILIVMQPPRNAKDQLLLQRMLEKVHVVTEELINVSFVETIWFALITFAVLK
jgi:hypothetical protein